MSRALPRSWNMSMHFRKEWAEEETRSLSQANSARAEARTLELGCLRRHDSVGMRNCYPAQGTACGGT
eukprot:3296399-Pleurochrysis_carterae.AAC.1